MPHFKEIEKIQTIYHKVIYDALSEEIVKILNRSIPIVMFSALNFAQKTSWVAGFCKPPQLLLEEAQDLVLESASFLCGLLRDKEDSMLGDLRFIDNFGLNALREERMLRLMIFEAIQADSDRNSLQLIKPNLCQIVAEEIENDLFTDLVSFFETELSL